MFLQAIEFQFQPIGGWLLSGGAAVVFVGLLLLAYRQLTRPVTRRAWQLLLVLRLAVAVLVILLMVRPALVVSEVRREQSIVIILQDVSASMAIADMSEGRSRSQAIREMLDSQRQALGKLAADCQLVVYAFSDQLTLLVDATDAVLLPGTVSADELSNAVNSSDNNLPGDFGQRPPSAADVGWQMQQALLEPGRASSRLGDALKQAAERHLGQPVSAIVLISDGRSTLSTLSATEAAAALAKRSIPIYALQVGSAEAGPGVRDVALRNFSLPGQAFAGNRVHARADVLVRGFRDQQVRVNLLVNGTVRNSQTIEVRADEQIERVELPFDVEVAGEHRVSLKVDAMPDELTLKNNESHGWLRAAEGGIRVLLVSGSLRTEGLYLSRALRQAGEFELTRVVVSDAASAVELLPVDAAGWAEYNVIILDDVGAGDLPASQMEALQRAVGSGSGLVMLGSQQNSYASGGYRLSPLAAALPVVLAEREPAALTNVRFLPTAAGFRTRVMQIAATPLESEKAWQSLPALAGGHRFVQPRQTADVLAAGEQGEPLLVVGQHDRGRVAALAVDTTYQWVLEGNDEPPGVLHQRFWRQLIMLLAGQEPGGAGAGGGAGGSGGAFVSTDRTRYSLPAIAAGRQAVAVTAAITDARGRSVTDATLELALTAPNGEMMPVQLWRRGQQSEAALEPGEAGDYLLTLTARRGRETMGTARARFIVEDTELELENPTADAALMTDLAQRTGGRLYLLSEAGNMFEDLTVRQADRATVVPVSRDLWDHWGVLAAFVLLLGSEWALRKRQMLV